MHHVPATSRLKAQLIDTLGCTRVIWDGVTEHDICGCEALVGLLCSSVLLDKILKKGVVIAGTWIHVTQKSHDQVKDLWILELDLGNLGFDFYVTHPDARSINHCL
jgi:hypothetical protein